MPPKVSPIIKSLNAWPPAARSSAYGVSAFLRNAWRAWKNVPDRVAPGLFPPELVVQVKALACELPAQHEVPLSRWRLAELSRHVLQNGLVGQVRQTTLSRLLRPEGHPSLPQP